MNKYTEDDLREELKFKQYEYGFYIVILTLIFPVGLDESSCKSTHKRRAPVDDRIRLMLNLKKMGRVRLGKCTVQKKPGF